MSETDAKAWRLRAPKPTRRHGRRPRSYEELAARERGAALLEQLGANAQRAARGPVAKSPAAERREHGYELDRGFGQAVAHPLAGSRVLTGEQSRLDESLESVGENV
jgi:hypothetical protein